MLRSKLNCMILVIPGFTVAFGALSAHASDKPVLPQQLPPVFEAVIDCRMLTSDSQRLDCYDRNVAALAAAQDKEDIVVADRAMIRETKRSLFGFVLPRLKLFGATEGEDVNQIDGTLAAVRTTPDGLSIFALTDGARWRQIDGGPVFAKVGESIKIKRGALGSYLAKVGKSRALRVVRLSQ